MTPTPPDHPAGPFEPVADYDELVKSELIASIRQAPARLRDATAGLTDVQLDTLYRNWTVRQITHHVADSHLQSIIRFKWTLTEDQPTIKAYDQDDWAALADGRHGDIQPTLALLDGLHWKWVQLLESMTEAQYARAFTHPETGASVSLWQALNLYAWHGRHHTAQIAWLREHRGWPAP